MNNKQTFLVAVYAVALAAWLFLEGTHEILSGNYNYSPTSFSFAHISSATWLSPAFGLAMMMWPWWWRVKKGPFRISWNLFPSGGKISAVIGRLLSILNVFFLCSAVIATIVFSLDLVESWYSRDEFEVMCGSYLLCGIPALIVNVVYWFYLRGLTRNGKRIR